MRIAAVVVVAALFVVGVVAKLSEAAPQKPKAADPAAAKKTTTLVAEATIRGKRGPATRVAEKSTFVDEGKRLQCWLNDYYPPDEKYVQCSGDNGFQVATTVKCGLHTSKANAQYLQVFNLAADVGREFDFWCE